MRSDVQRRMQGGSPCVLEYNTRSKWTVDTRQHCKGIIFLDLSLHYMAFMYIKQQSHPQDVHVSFHFFATLGLLSNCGLCLQYPIGLSKTSQTSSPCICLPLAYSGQKAVPLLLQLLLECQALPFPSLLAPRCPVQCWHSDAGPRHLNTQHVALTPDSCILKL